MKERPILFTSAEVRATLDGGKNQLRRIVKVQPPATGYVLATCMPTTSDRRDKGRHRWIKTDGHTAVDDSQPYFASPCGYEGDRLWVRETFQPLYADDVEYPHANWKTGAGYAISYLATDGIQEFVDSDYNINDRCKPSVHMPRWASRILLEIIAIRVERLQKISNEDAVAEGIGVPLDMRYAAYDGFRPMWKDIHGAGSWMANPWVWVVEFKRITSEVN